MRQGWCTDAAKRILVKPRLNVRRETPRTDVDRQSVRGNPCDHQSR